MIEGSCHCGQVRWSFDGVPESATACNCTICRRYGALWAYDFEGEKIKLSGPTRAYMWGERISVFISASIAAVSPIGAAASPREDGRRRVGVNLRMAEPKAVGQIPIHHLDGLETWKKLAREGRCVSDMWF